MNTPTGIEAQVCEDIAARQQMGIAKYKCTVEDSTDDMLQHAYEEALDLAVYLKAEIKRKAIDDALFGHIVRDHREKNPKPQQTPHPAVWTVHAPNGFLHTCESHANKLESLMRFMGASTSKTPAPEGTQCENCINETKKLSQT